MQMHMKEPHTVDTINDVDAVNEDAVSSVTHATGRGDAGDPESTEVTLSVATVAERELTCAHERDLGLLLVP